MGVSFFLFFFFWSDSQFDNANNNGDIINIILIVQLFLFSFLILKNKGKPGRVILRRLEAAAQHWPGGTQISAVEGRTHGPLENALSEKYLRFQCQ